MERYSKTYPQGNLRTAPQRVSSALGIERARAAHATPEIIVTRERFMLAGAGGARNVAENPPTFVYSRGRRLVPDVDAPASALDALRRHARAADREETPRPTWQNRRAA